MDRSKWAYKRSKEDIEKILFHVNDQFSLLRKLGKMQKKVTIKAVEHFLFKQIPKIYYIGCGTSLNAALTGAEISERLLTIPAEAMNSFEFMSFVSTSSFVKGSAVIAISHSGESKVTTKGVLKAKERDCYIIALTAYPSSTLANTAHVVFPTGAADEKVGPKTKGHTACLVTLYGLLFDLARRKHDLSDSGAGKLEREMARIPSELKMFIDSNSEKIKDVGRRFREIKHIIVVSTRLNMGVAKETALKIIETCNISAQAEEMEEMLHGPLYMVNRTTGVILFASEEDEINKAVDVANSAAYLGACVAFIGCGVETNFQDVQVPLIMLSLDVDGLFTPLCNTLIVQQLISHIALERIVCGSGNA